MNGHDFVLKFAFFDFVVTAASTTAQKMIHNLVFFDGDGVQEDFFQGLDFVGHHKATEFGHWGPRIFVVATATATATATSTATATATATASVVATASAATAESSFVFFSHY
jgi:hypothetical protein